MMEGNKYMATVLLVVNIILLVQSTNANDKTNGLDRNGTNVCEYVETISKKFNESYFSQRFTTLHFKTCNWLGKNCYTRTRLGTKNVVSTRLVTKYVDRNVYYCCNGWTKKDKNQTTCEAPICTLTCMNGGTCVKPDTCECKNGFSGSFCQLDKDECKDPKKNQCSQLCLNTKGGFRCACNNGYKLLNDSKTCLDIDECMAGKNPCGCQKDDGVCTSTCVNTDGSYTCRCSRGYYKNSADLCEDVNECAMDQKICDQKCVNRPGSYGCQCFKGFRYDDLNKKCIDIDECSVGNGSCSDKCLNTVGSYVCACPYGKYLTSDGKTCKDIDLTIKSATFCQSGSIGMLSCDTFTDKINVTSVFYGRATDKVCKSGDYTSNLNCVAPNAEDNLKECNGMPSCLVMMDLWSDPCPGVEKYATVIYKCQS